MAGLNGDSSTRGYAGEVVIVTDIGDIWSNTPDIRSVHYRKECPNDCGEVLDVERYPKPEETHAESISRTYDALVAAVGNHLAFDCEGD